MGPRILLVDNIDSFTFNLYQYLGELSGCAPHVIRHDATPEEIKALRFDCVVISPGPGHPGRERDFGICPWIIEQVEVPILGICLGHQGIGAQFGAPVSIAPVPMHGRSSQITHSGDVLFDGIPAEFEAIRYHSLILDSVPGCLDVIARTDDLIMAIRHREKPIWGVQFHPESVGTVHGKRLLQNFLNQVQPGTHSVQETVQLSKGHEPTCTPCELTLSHHRLPLDCDAESVFLRCFDSSQNAFWLDSLAHATGMGRFSYLGDLSGPLSAHYQYMVSNAQWTGTGSTEVYAGPAFAGLRHFLERYRLKECDVPFDFQGGLVGYLGYELKAETEGRPAHSSEVPDAQMFFVDRFCVVDHERSELYICALTTTDISLEQMAWIEEMTRTLATREENSVPSLSTLPSFSPLKSRTEYLSDIESALREIGQGETYEVCLTTQWVGPPIEQPLDAYRTLRASHQVPFAAYLRMGTLSVGSVSPERFLKVSPQGRVQAKPIKGTAARAQDPQEDIQAAEHLRQSEKDRAENLMIVDLLRNDLGRVCVLGSVEVSHLMDIESYAVHQMVSTIEGQLAPECDVFDLLQSAFPGGSMTGAPKSRTMEILDDLEGGARGVYSGCIGYLSLSGSADFNIVIRTMVMTPKDTRIGVGGAIVALSNPEQEWSEVRLKVSSVLDALSADLVGDGAPKEV